MMTCRSPGLARAGSLSDLNPFKESVKVEFESMGSRISETDNQVGATLSRVERLEQEIPKMQETDTGVQQPEIGNPRSLSLMMGNIRKASFLDDEIVWLEKHCRTFGITHPGLADVYKKGVESSLVFVKCQSESHRDRFIQSTGDSSKQLRESIQDKPCHPNSSQRLTCHLMSEPLKVPSIYAMKKMLVAWGFNSSCIKCDIHPGIRTVGGREIAKVHVQNYALKFTWCDGEWQAWKELQGSTEMADIASKAEARWEKTTHKGKGKSPE